MTELTPCGTTVLLKWVRHRDDLQGFAPGTRILHVEETWLPERTSYYLRVWLLVPRSQP